MDKIGAEQSLFSKIHHFGVVVKDMDKAVEYFQSLGIGPFKSLSIPGEVTETTVYGKTMNFKLKAVVAKMGSIEMELIQPVEDAPIQEEFLKNRGEGINHLCFKVADYDREAAKLIEKGFNVIQGRKRTSGIKTGYFDTHRVGGVITELWQPPTE